MLYKPKAHFHVYYYYILLMPEHSHNRNVFFILFDQFLSHQLIIINFVFKSKRRLNFSVDQSKLSFFILLDFCVSLPQGQHLARLDQKVNLTTRVSAGQSTN